MAKHIYEYDNNGLARVYDDAKWYLIDKSNRQVCAPYSYIEECGEGYYRIELGTQKNILRPDGSIVLKEWHNDVFHVQHGFFIFGNTLRKSKTNPKTRYIQGVAHVSGIIVFPMIFENAQWTEKGDAIYAEIEEKPYLLTLDGSIFDPALSHLPKKVKIDWAQLFEKIANWILPGLQFYYRDTDVPVDTRTIYHVGDVLRAGLFMDVTTKLWKPAHKTRFLIASAHAAHLCDVDELTKNMPQFKEWNLCKFHFNSYFQVLDIYEKEECTQVFLLHIPPVAAFLFGKSKTSINLINEVTGKEHNLVSMARRSLDDKLKMDVHPRSLDSDFIERMHMPVGLDDDFFPVSLEAIKESDDTEVILVSKLIKQLSGDTDIEGFIIEEDNFPYRGVKDTVCEKCIYAKGIKGNGEGCGRLFINSFRNRYLKGRCEYHKSSLRKHSLHEELAIYREKKAIETSEKTADTYALNLLKDFIAQKLDGNIDNLKTFDISTLRDEPKFGDSDINRAPIIRAIMALTFSNTWPNLSVHAIEEYEYWCSQINHFQRLFGANICDQYFKGLQNFGPTEMQHKRALNVAHLINSIGNFWVLPNKQSFDSYLNDSKYKGYADKFLKSMYDVIVGSSKIDKTMQGILYKNRKFMTDYQGRLGWNKFVKNMLLNDYVNEEHVPKVIFKHVWSFMKGLTTEEYYEAFDIYCSFCEEYIPKRSELIIKKLKQILENN